MFYLGHKSEEGEQERDLDLEGFDADPGSTFILTRIRIPNYISKTLKTFKKIVFFYLKSYVNI